MTGIAIMGYGTVGCGVYGVIKENHDLIYKNTGLDLQVKRILDIRDLEGEAGKIATKDFNDIINDPEINIVVETIGGIHPAFEYSHGALDAGKSVVTSNKELVADCGGVFLRKAKELGLNYMFEGSVGGGIPIIRSIMNSLRGEDIVAAKGILNGTTNFILTKMLDEDMEYAEALKRAQDLGYAEKDPTDDVDGIDSCRKIAIIASLIYMKAVDPADIHTEGITDISIMDLKYADRLKMAVKLVARFQKTKKGVAMSVTPLMLKRTSPLYGVNGVNNGVTVTGTAMGEIMYYGKGAGMYPTASAVVADVIKEAQNEGTDISPGWDADRMFLEDILDEEHFFFVRAWNDDMAKALKLFGDVRMIVLPERPGEFGFLTPVMTEREFISKYNTMEHAIKYIRGDIDADS
ncbi:MAG: homoserine dehydrogenase [Lachnospiraceae bacterium]|nr:homoserine dehydrogenase [Lachnospiraceae bacterium]